MKMIYIVGAASVVSAIAMYLLMSSLHDAHLIRLEEQHSKNVIATQHAQVKECDRAKTAGEELDHESNQIRSSTDAGYIAGLNRLLTKARADLATCKAAGASSRISNGETEAQSAESCGEDNRILELGYDGQRNGEIAQALQKWVCVNIPETKGCD